MFSLRPSIDRNSKLVEVVVHFTIRQRFLQFSHTLFGDFGAVQVKVHEPLPSTIQRFWGLANALKEFHGNPNEEPNGPQPTKEKPPILRNEAMSG